MNTVTVMEVLAAIGVCALLWIVVRIVASVLSWIERSEIERQARETASEKGAAAAVVAAPAHPKSAPQAAKAGIPAEHVAVIAAAVAAVLEGHRVVLIEDSGSGQVWSAEGRWMHQTSHRVH